MNFDLSDLLPLSLDDTELAEIAQLLAGDFNCLKQAERDSRANPPIKRASVHMHIVPTRIDGLSDYGYVFYLEQAVTAYLNTPYRQRIYLLSRNNSGQAVNRIFDIKEAGQFVLAWKNPEALKQLTADRLLEARGCDVIWTRVGDNQYHGIAGEGGSCRTSYGGATHIKVQIHMTDGLLQTLDQGFDDGGVLMFGPSPEEGHYQFQREVIQY